MIIDVETAVLAAVEEATKVTADDLKDMTRDDLVSLALVLQDIVLKVSGCMDVVAESYRIAGKVLESTLAEDRAALLSK